MVERRQPFGEGFVAWKKCRVTRNRYHIVWILLLAALLRFVQIGAPPVGHHAWRQSDTASVARNYLHNGHRLLYPQIDWETPGHVEMEFPIFPWVASLIPGRIAGTETSTRFLALLGALVTITFLYLLVSRILGQRAALWSAFLYAILPANLFFGRAIMPESWMLAATAMAMYYFVRWLDDESWPSYALAVLAATLACLLKITSLYLGLPLLWLAWRKWGTRSLRQWQLWLFAALVVVSLILWYGHAYRLGQQFGASFHILTGPGEDKWGAWGLLLDPGFYNRVFLGYLGGRILTWAGLLVFVLGLSLPRLSSQERLFDVWLLAVVIVLLLANGGSYQHDYYSLPIALPAVVFVAKVFDRKWQHRTRLVAAAALILLLSGYRYVGALADERQPGTDVEIASALSSGTDHNDLVISCNGRNPVWLYLAQRRGWGRDCNDLEKPELSNLIKKGARYLIADRRRPPPDRLTSYLSSFQQVDQDNETVISFRLGAPRRIEDLTWVPVREEKLRAAAFLNSMDIRNGWWRPERGSVVGTRIQKPALASTREAIPACQVCRLKLSVSLLQPPEKRARRARSGRQRGSRRAMAHSSLDLWWRDPGTGITLTLATKEGSLTLQQFEEGILLSAKTVDYPIVDRRRVRMELRHDGLELELLVQGQSILLTQSRLATPLTGRMRIRPRLGTIQMHRFEMWTPAEFSDTEVLHGVPTDSPSQDLRRIDFETGRLD